MTWALTADKQLVNLERMEAIETIEVDDPNHSHQVVASPTIEGEDCYILATGNLEQCEAVVGRLAFHLLNTLVL